MPVAAPVRRRPHLVDLDDAALVRRACVGDEAAFAVIVDRHRPAVATVARSRLGEQGDPSDVVQETFVAAWRKLHTLRDPLRLRPWLLQIARRTAIDHGRRYRRAPVDLGDDHLTTVEDAGPGPEDLVELGELAARLDVALDGLGRRDATAIALATHLGLGPDAIGAALGVTPGNAKVILHRARARLRAAIEASGSPGTCA